MTTGIVRWTTPLLLAGGMMLAGCNNAPDGQVVAKVNGEEITQQQLDAAISQFGAAPNADKQTVRKAMLERLVEQRLVVAKAKEMGLSKTPEYLTASQAMNDNILSSLWSERVAQDVRVPLGSEIDDFIRANPGRFDKRQIFTVNQVRTAGTVLSSNWLPKQTSLAAVAQELKTLGIPYVTAQTTMDTSDLDPTLYVKLMNRDPSRPFAVPVGNDAIIGVIVSQESKPLDLDGSRRVAAGILRRRRIEAALKNAVAEYRRSADVSFQAAAPAGATTGATGTATASH